MPSSFAREGEVSSKFEELLTMLEELRTETKGNRSAAIDNIITTVMAARDEYVALGGPQSGSSGREKE